MSKFGLSQPVRRVEDPRLLKGDGRYTDDITPANTLYAVVLRSPHAAARIASLDIDAAKAVPGVAAIYTIADLKADRIGTLPCAVAMQNRDGSTQALPPRPVLADGIVHHVGDPVAFIVAETVQAGARRRRADRRAIRRASVGDRPRDARPTPVSRSSGPTCRTTSCFDWEIGDKAEADALFAQAARTRHHPGGQQPRRRLVHGGACRARGIRAGKRPLDAVRQHAGRLAGEEPDGPPCSAPIAGPVPRHHARRGRRLRHEAVPVRRARAHLLRGAQARTARQMGVRTQRSVSVRHAGPRQHHDRRDRRGRGRQVPGAPHPQLREHGRLSVELRARSSRLWPGPACWRASTASRRSTRT